METTMVEIGPFRLPGLVIDSEIPDEVHEQMVEWSKENNMGKEINHEKKIWMFKKEKYRNMFIMRWA